jgi:hypothetical protein
MLSFNELKKPDIMYDLFDKADLTIWPKEVQGLAFYAKHLSSKEDQIIIQAGEKLINSNIIDPFIYRGIIERSIKMKRKASYIENMIFESNKHFPEYSSEFEEMLRNSSLT